MAQAALVTGALVAVWIVVAPVASWVAGPAGLAAAGVGAGVCWLGAVFALALSALFHGPSAFMPRLLVGMLARTMFPLMLGTLLHMQVPALAEAGMIYYLLVFYMVSLALETAMLLAESPSSLPTEKAG